MWLSLRQVADLAQATYELALARRNLSRFDASEIEPRAKRTTLSRTEADMVQRVAFAVPRIGARVPWRADCLVQAMAARRWLNRHGIASDLHIGVRKTPGKDLDAHAWLTCGERIVTGGDVTGYVPLATPQVAAALRKGVP